MRALGQLALTLRSGIISTICLDHSLQHQNSGEHGRRCLYQRKIHPDDSTIFAVPCRLDDQYR